MTPVILKWAWRSSISPISSLEDDFLFASLYGPHTQRLTGLAASLGRLAAAAAAWHNAVSDAEKEADINYNDKVGNFCQKI